jgi:hypothetical protein
MAGYLIRRGICAMADKNEQKKDEAVVIRPSHMNQGTQAFRPDKQKEEESKEQEQKKAAS